MTIRLNKQLIEEIVGKVVAATNLEARRKALVERIKQSAVDLIRESRPAEFSAMIEGKPKAWFSLRNDVYCESMGDCPMNYVGTGDFGYCRVAFDDPEPVPSTGLEYHTHPKVHFASLTAEAKAWQAERDKLAGETRAFLLSCRTVEKVAERMPELAPFLPKSAAPNYALVAPSNLLSTLTQAGFAPAAA